jgi:hypothetical protein
MEEKKKAEIWEKILNRETEKLPQMRKEEEKELMELFKLAQKVKKLPAPSPSTQFKKKLLQNLLPRKKRKISLFKKALLLAATFAFLIIGTATASLKSLPGSPLYPIKRFIEKGELVLARNKVTKEKVIKKQAEERLKEAEFIEHKNPKKAEELRDEARKNLEKIKKRRKSKKGKSLQEKPSQNQGINRREEQIPKIEEKEREGKKDEREPEEKVQEKNSEKNGEEADTNSGKNR